MPDEKKKPFILQLRGFQPAWTDVGDYATRKQALARIREIYRPTQEYRIIRVVEKVGQ